MFFKQFYDQPLAQASYLIGCQATGDAIVVDPLRDITPYLEVAAKEGLRISHVTETHIHADFVSGARELAARTGAQLHLSAEGGPDWQYASAKADGARLVRDGDVIQVGNITLDVIHTPGHTPEHISFVVTDNPAAAGPMGILTGDFVFVGDVGRPDLLEKAAKIAGTMEAGAHTLFHSLDRFRALPDHLQVWPAHGAGSACGKALGAVPSSTVGYEKRANWGVATQDENEFVRMVLEGQPEPPLYFAQMKRINRDGPRVLGGIHPPAVRNASELPALMQQRAFVVDLRPAAAFAAAHIPDTLSIPYNRSFSQWAGWLLPYDADLYLLTDQSAVGDAAPADVEQAVHDMALIGLDRVVGWFDASAFTAWQASGRDMRAVPQLSAQELHSSRVTNGVQLIDVRGATEWEAGHLPDSTNIPVGHLTESLSGLDATAPIVVQCQSGARSMIASSVLLRAGRHDVTNLVGGFVAWRDAGLPVERSAATVP
jgi:hydroxyacylglutathione hydrolase